MAVDGGLTYNFLKKKKGYRTSFTWKIDLLKQDYWLKSPLFWIKEDETNQMYLNLMNTYVFDDDYILHLEFHHQAQLDYAEAFVGIIFCTESGCEVKRETRNINSDKDNVFLTRWHLNSVTITFNIVLVPHKTQIPIGNRIETTLKENASAESCAEVYSKEGLFSDVVTLKCDDQTLLVHSGILKARSSVLTTMLNVDMKEKENKEIIVSDIRSEVMEQLVCYLYSDLLPTDNIEELFRAADKYDIRCLRSKLEEILAKRITSDNYLDMMYLAKLYNLKHLKQSAILFIRDAAIDEL